MKSFTIDISRIEELQTLKDIHELEKIFAKAHSTIVNGAIVELVRKTRSGPFQKFDEMSTIDELKDYRKSVFKYLD